jgi:hypothetical protein
MKYKLACVLGGGGAMVALLLLLRHEPAAVATQPVPAEVLSSPNPRSSRPHLKPEGTNSDPAARPKTRIEQLEELLQNTHITAAQLASYLEANRRSAGSLLGAYGVTRDRTLLDEAIQKYPDNPRVALSAWFRSETPEAKREWLESLGKTDPNNSLPDYLLANELLKAGETGKAIEQLQGAWSKTGFTDYAVDSIQDREEAYLAAGLPELEAKILAGSGVELPHLAKMKELGRSLVDIAGEYLQGNDADSADATRQLVLQMGQRLSSSPQFLIEELVGIAIENGALNAMDPVSPIDAEGTTAGTRLEQLRQRKSEMKSLIQTTEQALRSATDAELMTYFERIKLSGDASASEWIRRRYPAGN